MINEKQVWSNASLECEYSLLIAGKLLLLAQLFEMECKRFVIGILNMEKALKNDPPTTDYVEKLQKLMMGGLIEKLKKRKKPICFEFDIQLLIKAKNSRNFICHELLGNLIKEGNTDFHQKAIKDNFNKSHPNSSKTTFILLQLTEPNHPAFSARVLSRKYKFEKKDIIKNIKILAHGICEIKILNSKIDKEFSCFINNKKYKEEYFLSIQEWVFS